jgi:hypothetical protein
MGGLENHMVDHIRYGDDLGNREVGPLPLVSLLRNRQPYAFQGHYHNVMGNHVVFKANHMVFKVNHMVQGRPHGSR